MTVFGFLGLVAKAIGFLLGLFSAGVLFLLWATFRIERRDVGANPPRAR